MSIEWFENLNVKLQVVIISSGTSIILFILKCLYSWFKEKYSLRYKMRIEYDFVQQKKIKEQLAKIKTPLIKSAEELNYRLWNLSTHIDKGWHNIPKEEWTNNNRYYLRSFCYRLISFLYWILKAEESIYSFDLSMADKADQSYLKHIKTLKHFFCERELLEELGYDAGQCSNHFYKDELYAYINYIDKQGICMDYIEFQNKFKDNYCEIEKVIKYISEIKSTSDNLNYNTIKSFHIFLILFLNKYGLEYHKTDKAKIKQLIDNKYSDLRIKKGLLKFIERNKVKKEAKIIIQYFKLKGVN